MARRDLWPGEGILQFPLGQNTRDAVNLVPAGALVTAENCDLDETGAVAKTTTTTVQGIASPSAGTGLLGLYELVLVNDTRLRLLFTNDGKLYQRTDADFTQNLPIRRYSPYGHTAVERASGAVGANLANSTKYEYRFVAVDAAGKTNTAVGVEITTDATANPIDVTAKGVYGATSYEIWRRTYSGGWGAWGRLATGLTHTTSGGKTTVTYADDGNTAPDTGQTFPASNTTTHTLNTSNRVDAVIEMWSGQNALYFINGAGLCRTDGTNAELVTPYNPSGAEETSVGINALGDVTWGGHTCTNIGLHHRYGFLGGHQTDPRMLMHSRVADLTWWPVNSYIRVPDPRGGKVLDFITKDDALLVGLTTSVYALFGRTFTPDQANNDYTQVFFGEIEEIGLYSGWTLHKWENGWVGWLGADKRVRALVNVSPVKEQNVVLDVGAAIQPTLDALTDHANAGSGWARGQYWLFLPADKTIIRFYVMRRGGEYNIAPVVDTSFGYNPFSLLVRKNGDLWSPTVGDGAAASRAIQLAGTSAGYSDRRDYAITWKIKTPQLDCGVKQQKKFRNAWLVFKEAGVQSMTYEVQVGQAKKVGTLETGTAGTLDYMLFDSGTFDYAQAVKYRVPVNLKGDWLQLTLSHAENAKFPVLYGLFIEYTPRRRVKR